MNAKLHSQQVLTLTPLCETPPTIGLPTSTVSMGTITVRKEGVESMEKVAEAAKQRHTPRERA